MNQSPPSPPVPSIRRLALSWLEPSTPVHLVMLAVGCLLAVGVVVTPLYLKAQVALGVAAVLMLLVLYGRRSREVSVLLCVTSSIYTARYLWWRMTDTLVLSHPAEGLFSILLFLAEIYAGLGMALGYVQSVWPLGRTPAPLPDDIAAWPTVDILIPTYNEPLEIVRQAIWAAQDIDWPADKMRIYVLDDGNRREFKEFAARNGVGYLTRSDNRHAKAGNLNAALARTDGELVAVFDCDHVPNRAFLQMTVGGFLRDPKLAIVQTPHHFYSQDPIQRNLTRGHELAGEGLLFYGLIQDGNDLWNASFFCGSCAVLRREALAEIGGFAVETVTEDAHTALRLQRHGWNTEYLRLPLAAGLATERLVQHLGQRARWARGMVQIARLDSPLLGRGLTLPQRLCYLNAMLYYFFALPRIVVLTAPLCYLLFGMNIIGASPIVVLAYAIPHLILSVGVNQRLQGAVRPLFMAEVYETMLAFHLLVPTLRTVLNPYKGAFNVTRKGDILDRDQFDGRSVLPQLATLLLLLGGYIWGIGRYLYEGMQGQDVVVLVANLFWAFFSIAILAAAAAAGVEKRQVRRQVRIGARLQMAVTLPDGRAFVGETRNISMGGALLAMDHRQSIDGIADRVTVELTARGLPVLLPARVIEQRNGTVRLAFDDLDDWQHRQLVRAIFGRADAWLDWTGQSVTGVRRSAWAIMCNGFGLIAARRRARRTGGLMVALGLAGLLLLPAARAMSAPAHPGKATSAPPAAASPGTPPSEAVAEGEPTDATPLEPERGEVLTLTDLGAGALTFHGVQDFRTVDFPIRRDDVVTAAKLTLSITNSPALLKELSQLKVLLNDELLTTIPLNAATAGGQVVELPVNPLLIQQDNHLTFQFIGHYATGCEDPLHSSLWALLSANSSLRLTLQRLPVAADLSILPRPFFNDHDSRPLALPFLLGDEPSDGVLRAAGIVASWFGAMADYRPARFPSLGRRLPPDNAVIFATPANHPAELDLGVVDGPMVAVRSNPVAPNRRLLLVMGRNDEELRTAALTLVLGASALNGAEARATPPLLVPRQPYDAPRWLSLNRSVRLGELVGSDVLQSNGMAPGPMQVPFRLPPDLFVWQNRGVPLHVNYRYPGGKWLDMEQSRLDVSLNGTYVTSLKLREDGLTDWFRTYALGDYTARQRTVEVPPYLFYGRNQLQFMYSLQPVDRGACHGTTPDNLRTGVDPDSTLDLSSAHHFAALPNMASLASAGFPYSRMADLSQTVVVLPERPQAGDVTAYLGMMGLMGASTGMPATQVTVRRASEGKAGLEDRDLLLIGDTAHQPLLRDWAAAAPVRITNDVMALNTLSPLQRLTQLLDADPVSAGVLTDGDAERVLVSGTQLALMMGFESPLTPKRSVVALTAGNADLLPGLVEALRQPRTAPRIQGDLVILNRTEVSSFQVGRRYWVGDLPPLMFVVWGASRHPILVLGALGLAILLISVPSIRFLRRRAQDRLARTGS
ncbi:UDP-forming cellulose synthase catalytic subunit [Nitrospirillum pindoramense]|uniref:UDP-forming cellulose synthase catalytic subunit n=1 Tax=Nitrospirillum amazonense TaxID=28077 RepID=UPI001646D8BB|nr:UDP-forming cellulose synthase catalytic subunit [Nitrospirillum amazonense]